MSADALHGGRRRSPAARSATSSTGSTGASASTWRPTSGHAAVRRWVMGDEASERAATADEIRRDAGLVDDAMRRGRARPVAPRSSTCTPTTRATRSRRTWHRRRRSWPCHRCSPATGRARWSTCAASFGSATTRATARCCADMVRASGGKPMHANLLLRFTNDPDIWRACLDVLEGYAREGLRVLPDGVGQPEGPPPRAAPTRSCSTRCRRSRARSRCRCPSAIAALRDPGARPGAATGGRRRPRPAARLRLAAAARGVGRRRTNRPHVGRSDRRHRRRAAASTPSTPSSTCRSPRTCETVFVIDRPVTPGGPRRHPLPARAIR